jgi:hypothetical protein
MGRPLLITFTVAALLLTACGAEATDPGRSDQPDDAAGEPDDAAGQDGADGFDRDAARAEAEALLGTRESEVEETADRRIVRRGDEQFIVTMDLRPGRQNLELDEDDSGTYVVTRVVVETPEGGDDNLVIE